MKNKQNGVSQAGWIGEQNNTAQRLYRKHKKHTEDNKAHRKHRHLEGDGYSLKRSKWWAGTLVNALRVAKIRSNLHTGQYAGGVPCDHGQRQALVEPLSLPGVTPKCQRVSVQDSSRRGQWTCVHTSGFDCNWLKVIIVKCQKRHFFSGICRSRHQLLRCLVYIAALTM